VTTSSGPSTNRLRARTPRATIVIPRPRSAALGSRTSLSHSRARRACVRVCVCRVVGGGDGGGGGGSGGDGSGGNGGGGGGGGSGGDCGCGGDDCGCGCDCNGGIPTSVTTFLTGSRQPREQIAATPTTRTTWTSRTGRGPGTASSGISTHESTRCFASSVRLVQRPTRYYLSPLPLCLSRSPYRPLHCRPFAPSPSGLAIPRARVGREDVGRTTPLW